MASLIVDWQNTPSGLPLFQRIAESIAREIRRGRLRPGQKLPSSRSLASALAVNRNTVLGAFSELERQGYISTRPASGTFVKADLPERSPRRNKSPGQTTIQRFSLPAMPPAQPFRELDPKVLALVGGQPDLRLLPTDLLARAMRSAMKSATSVLDYQSERGHPRLLRVLGEFLRDTRGVVSNPEEMIITRGSQQALHLAARAILRPGSVIAVERYGYPPAWEGFRLAGAELVSVGVDRQGLRVDDLARLCSLRDVAAVYVTPHHQYPTTVTLSGARRMQLLRLAREKQFCVIEDDYDHEYHFRGRPILPLASSDPARVVIHIGTLSKVFAPGLRLGYAVAQAPIIDSMCAHRRFIDRQGDHVMELSLAHLIEDGVLSAHIRRMYRAYEERRSALHAELRAELAGALSFQEPAGGLALWTRVLGPVRPEDWCEQAAKLGLLVHPASRFRFDERSAPNLRLGFARHNPDEIRAGVKLLAQSFAKASSVRCG